MPEGWSSLSQGSNLNLPGTAALQRSYRRTPRRLRCGHHPTREAPAGCPGRQHAVDSEAGRRAACVATHQKALHTGEEEKNDLLMPHEGRRLEGRSTTSCCKRGLARLSVGYRSAQRGVCRRTPQRGKLRGCTFRGADQGRRNMCRSQSHDIGAEGRVQPHVNHTKITTPQAKCHQSPIRVQSLNQLDITTPDIPIACILEHTYPSSV